MDGLSAHQHCAGVHVRTKLTAVSSFRKEARSYTSLVLATAAGGSSDGAEFEEAVYSSVP
jgi:hypothetical protein